MDFEARKRDIVTHLALEESNERDKSPKGYIDVPIVELMRLINGHADYVTTSSCSGRIAVYAEGEAEDDGCKTAKGGEWLYVTHERVGLPDKSMQEQCQWCLETVFGSSKVVSSGGSVLSPHQPLIYFKFEPLVLHVEASSAEAADSLTSIALQVGYRNSGIIPSRTRHMLAIRSTLKLDLPIAYRRNNIIHLLVEPSYLLLLIHMSNAKFDQNLDRLQLLEDHVQQFLNKPPVESKQERRIRKQREGREKQLRLQALCQPFGKGV
ncbi:hypothetical protein BZG36_05145 [Bifiguratus adelaidae]|uniref:tRNA wybutosine-synthesizing protein 3 n=1 Tax=Bifiguratus adelaidae TaxID=1938954 RepID=A0A261XU20_9FUNG|nr:hypothetical protein BZG36_05145 [Bifiguratus adelaidae]